MLRSVFTPIAALVGAKALLRPEVARADSAPFYVATGGGSDTGFQTTGSFQVGVSATGGRIGVLGIHPGGTIGPTTNAAVVGAASGAPGVEAHSDTGYAAVLAIATNTVGVQGSSPNNYGLQGISGTSAGVIGTSTNGDGVVGTSTNGYAGHFFGAVLVEGDFAVTGVKNAVVPFPDGSHRRVYSLESPESWFEDFGDSVLTSGRALVKLDPEFATAVHRDAYHVFLAPKGDTNGLYVSNQSESGFEVRESKGGSSTVEFSYRIVAKRKDVTAPRLARVTLAHRRPLVVPPR
jgi:hypothetical protein